MEVKVKKNVPFSIIPNTILEDQRLSWKSKGLLCYLISRPDGWKVLIQDLIKRSTDGRDAVKTALAELRVAGYAEIIKERNEKGQVQGSFYQISDTPIIPTDGKTNERKTRRTENPTDGKPDGRKTRSYNNKDNNNKDNNNKEEEEEEKESVAPSATSLFEEPSSSPLVEFLNAESAWLATLPGQPSEFQLFSLKLRYSAEKISAAASTLSAWLKKQKGKKADVRDLGAKLRNWLSKELDETEEAFVEVWRTFHQKKSLPCIFFEKAEGDDRKSLQIAIQHFINAESFAAFLAKMPSFWVGKRLPAIVKNIASIIQEAKNEKSKAKGPATIQDLSWI